MKLATWLQTRDGAIKENKFSRMALAIQTFVILALTIGLVNKDTTIVLVPATLTEKSEVGASFASKQTKVMWGMYLANLFGNVTPTSSKVLKDMVSPHLTSSLWGDTREAIDKQVEEINKEQLSLSFAPTIAREDPATGYVIVTGELVIRGLRGQERRELRTYEMGFVVRNYNVMLDHLRVMQGKYAEDAANAAAAKSEDT